MQNNNISSNSTTTTNERVRTLRPERPRRRKRKKPGGMSRWKKYEIFATTLPSLAKGMCLVVCCAILVLVFVALVKGQIPLTDVIPSVFTTFKS